MSGPICCPTAALLEGVPVRAPLVRRTAEHEQADVLAYLARKQANAEAIAMRTRDDLGDNAVRAARLYSVLADDIRAGLHVGEADVAGMLDPAGGGHS